MSADPGARRAGLLSRARARVAGEGLEGRALRGTLASVGFTAGSQAMRFASNIVLARLLFPEAFGLMALVAVVLAGLEMLSTIGLRVSVMQNPRGDDPDFLNTVWTLQILRGGLIWLAVLALSGPVAAFYGEPLLAQLLPVAALGVVITGFHPTKVLTAQRHLALGRLMALRLVTQAVHVAVMVALAAMLQSVWALVIGNVVQAALLGLLCLRFLPGPGNRPRLETRALRDILSLGKWLFFSTIASYAINQGDRAILGTAVSTETLGVYSIAFSLAMLPYMVATQLGNQVVFPLYRMRHPLEGAANRRSVFRARRMAAAGALALAGGAAWLGPPLIGLLYDDRYALAAPMIALLAVASVPMIAFNGLTNAALAKGDSRRFMIMNVATATVQVALLLWAAPRLGVPGAALAIGLAPLLSYPLLARVLRRYANWDPAGDAALLAGGFAITGAGLWAMRDGVGALF